MSDKTNLTNEAGAPVVNNQISQTAGPDGPIILQDNHLIEKLAQFDRERIPERVVHAKALEHTGYLKLPKIFRNSQKLLFKHDR